jgi:hypothetical protein
MPRRRVPVAETKAEKSRRLADYRSNIVLDALRKLGSLSNRDHYGYSEEEIKTIFDTLERALLDTKKLFMGRPRHDFRL